MAETLDLDEWARWLAQHHNLRPRTIGEYVKIARKSLGTSLLAEISRTDVSQSYLTVARAAVLRLVEWSRPASLPGLRKRLSTLNKPRRKRQLPPPPIVDAEWQRLKVAVARIRDPARRSVIELMMIGGLRIGDALGIERSRILAAQSDPAGAFRCNTKGGKTLDLPLGSIRIPIARLMRLEGWGEAWEAVADSRSAAEEGVRRSLRRAAKEAGISRRMHPHLLRHTVAYRLIERTKDIHLVSRLLGHSSLETTMLYTWYRSLKSMGKALGDGDGASPNPTGDG